MWKHSEDCWAVWPQSSAEFLSWILLTSHLEQMTRAGWGKLEKLGRFRTVMRTKSYLWQSGCNVGKPAGVSFIGHFVKMEESLGGSRLDQ